MHDKFLTFILPLFDQRGHLTRLRYATSLLPSRPVATPQFIALDTGRARHARRVPLAGVIDDGFDLEDLPQGGQAAGHEAEAEFEVHPD